MKKREIKSVIEGLKAVKIAKLEDKAMRTSVFKTFMKLLGLQKQYESDFEDMRTVFLSAHKGEQEKVADLQQKLNMESDRAKQVELAKEINSHADYLAAVKELNEKVEALGNEEVEVEALDAEKFTDELQKQECDLSVIEQVYPLLK